jgi:calpain-15
MSQQPTYSTQGSQYGQQSQSGNYANPFGGNVTSGQSTGGSTSYGGSYPQTTSSYPQGSYTPSSYNTGTTAGWSDVGTSYPGSYTTGTTGTTYGTTGTTGTTYGTTGTTYGTTGTTGTTYGTTGTTYPGTTTYGTTGTTYPGTTTYGTTGNSYPGTTTYGTTGTTTYGTTGTSYPGTTYGTTTGTSYPGTTNYGTTGTSYTTGTTHSHEAVKSSAPPTSHTSTTAYTPSTTYSSQGSFQTPAYTSQASANYGTTYTSGNTYPSSTTNYGTTSSSYTPSTTTYGNTTSSYTPSTTSSYTPSTTTTSTSGSTSGQMMIGGKAYNSWEDYLASQYPGGVSSTTSGSYSTGTTGTTSYATKGHEQVKSSGVPTSHSTTSYTAPSYNTQSSYSSYPTSTTAYSGTSYGTTAYTPSTTSSYTPSTTAYSGTSYGTTAYTPATTSYTPSTTSYTPSTTSYTPSTTAYTPSTYTPSTTAYTPSTTTAYTPSTTTYATTTATTAPIKAKVAEVKQATDQVTHKFEVKTVTNADGSTMEAKHFVDDPNSEFNQKKNQLKSSGQKFSDPEFPASMDSLIGRLTEEEIQELYGEAGYEWTELGWARADEYYGAGQYKIFNDGVSPDDIKQGELGDCYFLSVLAALAEWPHRIERLLVSQDCNDQCIYGVRICDMGEWREVLLDDQIPVHPDDGRPVFSSGNGNELWVLLLEKAWAKMYGSYGKIVAGLTREVLHDLTSAPVKCFFTDELNEEEKEGMWHDILDGDKKNYCMTCGAKDLSGDGRDDLGDNDDIGIVPNHAYSLLAAHEVTTKYGQTERLVELRNPWGKSEWKGAWSDESDEWTEQLKKQLDVKDADDGIFYMTFNDFLQYYSDAQICKVHDDYHYTSIKVNTNHKNGNFFKLTIPKDGKYYITVNQQASRHHTKAEDFKFSSVWIVLGKQNGDKHEHVQGVYKADREAFTEGHLTAGDYLLYVKVAWYDKAPRDFILSSYGPDDITFNKISKSDCPELVQKMYQHRGRTSKKLESYADLGQPNCFRAVELTEEGYGYIFYQNKSNKTLNESITFNVLEGLKLVKPYRGRQYDIKISPGEEKVVLLKCNPDCDGYRQSFSERSNFI